jgi:hypothetical protein
MEVSMIDGFVAADLLDECHAVLTRELIAALPAGKRYEARMIASAIARVSRQIKSSRRAAASELEALEQLAGDAPAHAESKDAALSPDRALEDRLAAARARLTDDIRAGRLDARLDNPGDLLRLREMVHARLQVTNPKLITEAS